ncbi:hypothetical protein OH76DRAFT_1490344 [Lentinus brumalis]|uniref:Uncharacterized protein n=1 Tax=Lentinus brumalis TaxID=2498619 RepID=A0A371CJ89_9APHY|nr:hypothetical protein OH76DRAFT_1490344 [Polyporus brumalis]
MFVPSAQVARLFPLPLLSECTALLLKPHLTFGYEVVLDVQESALEPLGRTEIVYLRRALSLGPQCQIAPLYIDTGLWSLRYRRLSLALRYIVYTLTDGPELLRALAALPVPVHALALDEFPMVPAVRRCLVRLKQFLHDTLTYAVLDCGRRSSFSFAPRIRSQLKCSGGSPKTRRSLGSDDNNINNTDDSAGTQPNEDAHSESSGKHILDGGYRTHSRSTLTSCGDDRIQLFINVLDVLMVGRRYREVDFDWDMEDRIAY